MGNDAVKMDIIHRLHQLDQRAVEALGHPCALGGRRQVNGGLGCPVIGGALGKAVGIGVSGNLAGRFPNQVGELAQGACNAPGKGLFRGHLGFKGNGRMEHIGRINGQKLGGVGGGSHAQSSKHGILPFSGGPVRARFYIIEYCSRD